MMEKKEILIPIPERKTAIKGDLTVSSDAKGIVLFAHGSGSGRFSPRNQYVAKMFNQKAIATLLIDLLTEEEEKIDALTGEYRFDIDLLSRRLMAATRWLKQNATTRKLPLGYFGASTGAAAALVAAAQLPDDVKAVVSRGGRPDLAMEYLPRVRAPTLFIVGGKDTQVLELNRKAMEKLTAEKRLEIVPGASHLFEEPGKLDEVVRPSIDWFVAKLSQVTK